MPATKKQIQMLEDKVNDLLLEIDQIKGLIVAHEFDAARMRANGLSARCESTNSFANALADMENA